MVEPYLRSYSRYSPQFVKLESSLQHSKQSATCPYLEIFLIISSTYAQIIHVICFLLVTSSEHSIYLFSSKPLITQTVFGSTTKREAPHYATFPSSLSIKFSNSGLHLV
jgi:hypothetical protein